MKNSNWFKKGERLRENHPLWKGENATYITKHKWVVYHKGRPKFCESCGDENKNRYEWANISGKYLRDLDDYIRLCKKCHFKFDGRKFGGKVVRPESWVDPKKQMNFKACLNCDKMVRVIRARLLKFKYCSFKCKYEAQKGIAPKIDNRGKKPWNAGKTGIYSEETRIRMGLANVGIRRSPSTEFKPKH